MARFACWLILFVVVLPAVVQVAHEGQSPMSVMAEEDDVEGEDEGTVEDEGGAEDATDDGKKNVHSDADTTLIFVKPAAYPVGESGGSPVELPAGQVVEFLVGFNNKGENTDLIIDTLDASFRYPLDFTYHIQNFSAVSYQKRVVPGQEASILYSLIPADAFAGRPIGLTVNLGYKDSAGNVYMDPVFNETVQIVEYEEGFDTEVFFMYVFLVAGGLLVLLLIYSFVGSRTKSKKPIAKPIETGTTTDDVDYEWIPRSALRTPGSGKATPRQRKSKRHGSDTE